MLTSFYLMLTYLKKYWKHFNNITRGGFIRILMLQFNAVFFNFGLLIFAHSCIMMATLFIITTKIFFIKLTQMRQMAMSKKMMESINITMSRYAKGHTKTLVMIQKGNVFYGTAFLIYLVLNLPFNVFVVMSIILYKNFSLFKIMFLFTLAAQGFVFIFGVHLMCALYTKRIHQDSKLLMHLNVHCPNQTIDTRLRLSNYIMKFHTKNCYGITYSKFGLITFKAFFKVGWHIYSLLLSLSHVTLICSIAALPLVR